MLCLRLASSKWVGGGGGGGRAHKNMQCDYVHCSDTLHYYHVLNSDNTHNPSGYKI